jgi:hypothetical protein
MIQAAALAAFQRQPVAAVTAMLAVPPVAAVFVLAGLIE